MTLLRRIVFLTTIAVFLVNVFGAVTISKRAGTTTTESSEENVTCVGRTPCGWAIYEKTTRVINYFMKNKCTCEGEKRCLRDDDDISITAYVYRCMLEGQQQQPPTSTL